MWDPNEVWQTSEKADDHNQECLIIDSNSEALLLERQDTLKKQTHSSTQVWGNHWIRSEEQELKEAFWEPRAPTPTYTVTAQPYMSISDSLHEHIFQQVQLMSTCEVSNLDVIWHLENTANSGGSQARHHFLVLALPKKNPSIIHQQLNIWSKITAHILHPKVLKKTVNFRQTPHYLILMYAPVAGCVGGQCGRFMSCTRRPNVGFPKIPEILLSTRSTKYSNWRWTIGEMC